MVMSGKRSTESLLSETMPSTMSMSDIIRMRTGFLSASRVSHMVGYRRTMKGATGLVALARGRRRRFSFGPRRHGRGPAGEGIHIPGHPHGRAIGQAIRTRDDDFFSSFEA